MSLALQLACICLAVSLAGAIVWFHERHAAKRAEDERWVDELIARHRADLQKRYRNGQFRDRSIWNQPR
jgi:hypothetical protein